MKTLLFAAGALAAATVLAQPLGAARGGPFDLAQGGPLDLARGGQAAQPGAATPPARFEVASIKRNHSGNSFVTFDIRAGRLSLINVPVRQLIVRAYQVQPFQIAGGPSWITSDGFDVVAKAEDDVPPAQMNVMLQSLLADRFKLVIHRENRPGDVFRLVKARADGRLGDGLKPATVECASRRGGGPGPTTGPAPGGRVFGPGPGQGPAAGPAPGPGGAPGGCFFMMAPGRLQAAGQSLKAFADTLSQQLGRPVLDETGLTGAYDLTLTFMPDSAGRGMPIGPPPPGAPELPPIDPNAPSLTTAIQEQLGLKLEAGRGPMEMIVIDRLEPPTED